MKGAVTLALLILYCESLIMEGGGLHPHREWSNKNMGRTAQWQSPEAEDVTGDVI